MNLTQTIITALNAFRQNKLRTFLSALGITIGVFTVIVIYSSVNGLNKQIEDQFKSIGTELISVNKYSWVGEGGNPHRKNKERPDLKVEDAEAIIANAPHVAKVAPVIYTRSNVSFTNENLPSILICGTNQELTDIEGYFANRGRFMSELEVSHARTVVVLGADIAEKLFPVVDPVGKYIKIAGLSFLVVGTLEPKGAIMGGSQDDLVFIPYNAFIRIFGSKRSISISCLANSQADFNLATEEIRHVMRTQHQLKVNDEDDFAINTSDQLLDTYRKITGTAFLVMILVGAISLLVGGIGIMNIMFVSVSERTFEIGLRKALGATQRNILTQFLVEAMVVCLIGGLLGMLSGVGVAVLIGKVSPMPTKIAPSSIVFGVGFMMLVGLTFGLLPARKAAKLPPIEALRYE
jgi:putative ABC transport system permease protein